jgi:AraC-like DNA-binding protein
MAITTSLKINPDRARRPVWVLADQVSAGPGAPHIHKQHQLVFADHGVMTVLTDEGRWVVPPQRAVWVPAGLSHRVSANRAFHLSALYVAPRHRADLPAKCQVMAITPLLRELLMTAAPWRDVYPRQGAAARLLEVALDQLRTLAVLPIRLPPARDARVRKITERLLLHPDDNRSLPQWGDLVGATARTLERLFRHDTGMSFFEWRGQWRLQVALEALASNEPVTEVALRVGYQDTSSFITMFRNALGVTPKRFFARDR